MKLPVKTNNLENLESRIKIVHAIAKDIFRQLKSDLESVPFDYRGTRRHRFPIPTEFIDIAGFTSITVTAKRSSVLNGCFDINVQVRDFLFGKDIFDWIIRFRDAKGPNIEASHVLNFAQFKKKSKSDPRKLEKSFRSKVAKIYDKAIAKVADKLEGKTSKKKKK